MMVTVIGRGHSGTRAMSHTLTASGVYMGEPLNGSGDLLPPEDMYEACRVLAPYVKWKGALKWDFSLLTKTTIPDEFTQLIHSYLKTVLGSQAVNKGWKIPETTLAYPWILRMFPEMNYLFWIRDPRDCVLGAHLTDNLNDFGISYPATEDIRLRRAISWKYQYDLVKATPKPGKWIEVRLEDFVLQQDRTLEKLGQFLGISLAKIPVKLEVVGRWRKDTGVHTYDFLAPAMRECGY